MHSICGHTTGSYTRMQDHDEYPLTPYDEYPVHQAPYPVRIAYGVGQRDQPTHGPTHPDSGIRRNPAQRRT